MPWWRTWRGESRNVRRAALLVLPLAWLLLVARASIFDAVPHSAGTRDHQLEAVIDRLKDSR